MKKILITALCSLSVLMAVTAVSHRKVSSFKQLCDANVEALTEPEASDNQIIRFENGMTGIINMQNARGSLNRVLNYCIADPGVCVISNKQNANNVVNLVDLLNTSFMNGGLSALLNTLIEVVKIAFSAGFMQG